MAENSHRFGIGDAVDMLWAGKKVRRAGWNGKGMHLELVTTGRFAYREDFNNLEPFVVMWTAQGTWVPWLCSQADLLAMDWELAE